MEVNIIYLAGSRFLSASFLFFCNPGWCFLRLAKSFSSGLDDGDELIHEQLHNLLLAVESSQVSS
jgi:hypothetical protein